MDTNKIKQITKKLKEAEKIVFFHHVKPDGDSLSSSYALMKAMISKFPNKEIKWVANTKYIAKRFHYLNIGFDEVITGEEVDNTWTVIIGDNAVEDRIYGSDIYAKGGYKIAFDHHRNDINFEHDIFWQESTLGASAIQAFMIAKELEVEYTSELAVLALYGILTDTGNFQFSLADHRPLKAAAELTKFIENEHLDAVYKGMKQKTQKDIAIQAYALSNYKLEDGVAYLRWTDETQKQMGLTPDDVARVNLIGNIKGSEAWIFFIEYKDEGYIRTEFRSLGLPVNEVAKKFGGGGHNRASGAKTDIDWKITEDILEETKKALKAYVS